MTAWMASWPGYAWARDLLAPVGARLSRRCCESNNARAVTTGLSYVVRSGVHSSHWYHCRTIKDV